jgi:hypothetical protein
MARRKSRKSRKTGCMKGKSLRGYCCHRVGKRGNRKHLVCSKRRGKK